MKLSTFIIVVTTFLLGNVQAKNKTKTCKHAVIGAGIGGVYSAWRLVVDSGKVKGEDLCIFEAKKRPGGRILSVDDPVPGFEGFNVDLGAYRYVC